MLRKPNSWLAAQGANAVVKRKSSVTVPLERTAEGKLKYIGVSFEYKEGSK